MSLQKLLLSPKKPEPNITEMGQSEIEHRAMRMLCNLRDELSKAEPDPAVVKFMIQDIDVIVVDYQRGAR